MLTKKVHELGPGQVFTWPEDSREYEYQGMTFNKTAGFWAHRAYNSKDKISITLDASNEVFVKEEDWNEKPKDVENQ